MNKQIVNQFLNKLANSIDISKELFDKAEKEYNEMGEWLNENIDEYELHFYPQGSFALGTVVKPISNEDDYDLDLVAEFEKTCSVSAKALKIDIIKPLLQKYKGKATKLEEKRRCWHVDYEHFKGFHLDVIPTIEDGRKLKLTHTANPPHSTTYQFRPSNPVGYQKWFLSCCEIQKNRIIAYFEKRAVAEIDELDEFKNKMVLQKTIQLLKRHRDVMFAEDENNSKPISVIITTLAAILCVECDDIYDSLQMFANNADIYMNKHKNGADWYLKDPSLESGNDEDINFAHKWNIHPERKDAFFEWIEHLKITVEGLTNIEKEEDIPVLLNETFTEGAVEKAVSNNVIMEKANSIIQEIPLEKRLPVVKTFFNLSHRISAPWKLPKGNTIKIIAKINSKDGDKYESNGYDLPKNTYLYFQALHGINAKGYKTYWQITNNGVEAMQVTGGLRGDKFELENVGKNRHKERTEYKGSHYVQCFLVKGTDCKAKSDVFVVNIE